MSRAPARRTVVRFSFGFMPCAFLQGLAAVLAGMITMACGHADADEAAGQSFDRKWLPVIATRPAELAEIAKQKQAAVFSINLAGTSQRGMMNKGFFIDEAGHALCSLRLLCQKASLRFDASDGQMLKAPVIVEVFAECHLALLKFDHRPKTWIEVSDARPTTGGWLALVSTLRDPDPLVVPMLSQRDVLDPEPTNSLRALGIWSFACGRNPAHEQVFAKGAPLIDASGKALGAYAGTVPLPAQTLRQMCPLAGLLPRIKSAIEKPQNLQVPVPKELHPYEDVFLDPAWMDLQHSSADASARGLQDHLAMIQRLLVDYPQSRTLKKMEWETMSKVLAAGPAWDEFREATLRSTPAGNASLLELATHHSRMGRIFMACDGKEAAAMESFQKAFDLAPQIHHTDGAFSAYAHLQRGELKQAAVLYQLVLRIAPEQIDYAEALKKVFLQAGDYRSADILSEWIWTLEDLYRTR